MLLRIHEDLMISLWKLLEGHVWTFTTRQQPLHSLQAAANQVKIPFWYSRLMSTG